MSADVLVAAEPSGTLDVDPVALVPTAEQQELRAVVRAFLEEVSGEEQVRRDMASRRGSDPATWSRLAGELDVLGLAVPEQYGGSGYGFGELAVVVEEAARALLCGPLLSSAVLATGVLLAAGDRHAAGRWLPGLAGGELTATVALPGRAAVGWDAAGRVSGRLDLVLDGHTADLLLLAVDGPDGPSLVACPRSAAVRSTPLPVLDATRRRATVELAGAEAVPVGTPGEADAVLAAVADTGRAALAAESVGITALALERCLDHLRARHQFGRPLGSFQALKHRSADLLVELEAARSAAAYATWATAAAQAGDPGAAQLPLAAAAAKAVGDGAAELAAAEFVQMHGGIGFTWEHAAHLYVRRVRSNSVLLGTAAAQYRRVAALIGLPGATR